MKLSDIDLYKLLPGFMKEDTLLFDMCDAIVKNKEAGIYDGAYKVVELAMQMKNK